ncbi:hypothetical protein M0657_006524 [Pyricularia oryzae]|uniref:Uncharacterized protein n=1 Tax=Pyricularia oryzae TaxID=318829 RepID=A0A4P7NH20_PYROR|nr:hypothetical protein M9X92_008000 [Pyricularia oryzae]KAI7920563.1 hypothetical protein M0657_006524 [Pyricularia oryzae]QBZ61247.1 hypothetical protein PoMZ_08195 [Pyricularia oryzae]
MDTCTFDNWAANYKNLRKENYLGHGKFNPNSLVGECLVDRTLNANVLAVAVRWAQFCIRGALQRTHYARGWGAEQKQH